MTGYDAVYIAIKPSNGGAYATQAVMGPDSISFANLNPVNPASPIRGSGSPDNGVFENLFSDTAETLVADVLEYILLLKRLYLIKNYYGLKLLTTVVDLLILKLRL